MVSAVFSPRKILVAAHFFARGARLPASGGPTNLPEIDPAICGIDPPSAEAKRRVGINLWLKDAK